MRLCPASAVKQARGSTPVAGLINSERNVDEERVLFGTAESEVRSEHELWPLRRLPPAGNGPHLVGYRLQPEQPEKQEEEFSR